MPSGLSGVEAPWKNTLPSGTVARKNDMPLWSRDEPHWRVAEWTALKILKAFRRVASWLGANWFGEDSRGSIEDTRGGKSAHSTAAAKRQRTGVRMVRRRHSGGRERGMYRDSGRGLA